ncbi:MarP family serine protease [Corynebacterium uterequi]|uniref:Serine protease n=1 Tax=Corynebacterium uterequi TaxID=1072256 RepID=A0A0G3HE37_9CORY|nr:MarP family serine protease [Corynebacterium uterequi]AKK10193.1 Trypsin-like peptidase domain/Colicin V production protein [Corynebacterium uterequi]
MSATLILDIVLVILAVAALVSGWRQGAVASLLSTVGIAAGLVIGLALTPLLAGLSEDPTFRLVLALGSVVVFVAMGNLVGALLGAGLRDRMRARASQWWDSVIGAGFQLVTTMVIAWMISVPLATGLGAPAATVIAGSTVLRGIDAAVPHSWAAAPSRIGAVLSESGLPPFVSPFDMAKARQIPAPALDVGRPGLVEELRPSVVQVVGNAPACSRTLLGSGFVTEPDYVITNAHVVAGTDSVQLDTMVGRKDATVVYFNPGVDIAVLHTPGLGLAPLSWSPEQAQRGDDALVLGYPDSGPFNAAPARVADLLRISGPDIYAENQVERQAYSVRGSIREGNSGGPLLNADGQVIGLVFGASRENTDVGFALTAQEVRAQVAGATALTQPVDAQRCV